jgi:hypothetical protein
MSLQAARVWEWRKVKNAMSLQAARVWEWRKRKNTMSLQAGYHTITRVGQNRMHTPYMIVYLVISLPKML